MTNTITLTLSEAQLEKARKKGLESEEALAAFAKTAIQEKLDREEKIEFPENWPKGLDPRLKGVVAPQLFGSVEILGDIIAPIDVEWEAMS